MVAVIVIRRRLAAPAAAAGSMRRIVSPLPVETSIATQWARVEVVALAVTELVAVTPPSLEIARPSPHMVAAGELNPAPLRDQQEVVRPTQLTTTVVRGVPVRRPLRQVPEAGVLVVAQRLAMLERVALQAVPVLQP